MPEPDELVEACFDGGCPSCIVIERVPAASSVDAAAVADIIASEFDDYEVWDRAERENIVDLNRELITARCHFCPGYGDPTRGDSGASAPV